MMQPVRPDISFPAPGGDGALHVQVDIDPSVTAWTAHRFTIVWAAPPGMPPHVALRQMAQFIIARGR